VEKWLEGSGEHWRGLEPSGTGVPQLLYDSSFVWLMYDHLISAMDGLHGDLFSSARMSDGQIA
jgi:hypothetical protein